MMARSRRSRNTRGEGLPSCGTGVTVPISAKPQPSCRMASGTRASLSKPAAIPTGLGNVKPANVTPSAASSGADAAGNTPSSSDFNVISCASSGGSSVSARGAKSNSIFSMPRIPWATSARRPRRAAAQIRHRRWRSAARRRGAGSTSPPRETSQRSVSPRTCVSNWINTRSCLPRKCLASVPAICSRVDKWIYPSRTSSAEPTNAPLRHASSHAGRGTTLNTNCRAVVIACTALRRAQVLFSCATAMFARATRRRLRVAVRARGTNSVRCEGPFLRSRLSRRCIVMLPSRKCRLPVLPRCREGQTKK